MAVDGLTGFEFRDPLSFFDSMTGVATVDTGTFYGGAASLKFDSAASLGQILGQKTLVAGTQGRSVAFRFMLDRIPTGGSANILSFRVANAVNHLNFLVTTAGAINAGVQGFASQTAGTLVPNRWYLLEFSANSSGTTFTIQWRLDSVAQTNATGTGLAASDQTEWWLGQYNGASRCVVWIDDVVTGSAVADHPLGNFRVVGYNPVSVGTHVTPASFTNTGTVLGAGDTTSWQAIDEAPATSTQYVEQATSGGTAYLEYGLQDSAEPAAMSYVSAVAAVHANGTGGNNSITKIRDGASEGTVFSGDSSGTAVKYKSNVFLTKPSGGAWTLAAFNALLLRFGFSTDVAPLPRLASFMLEAAYPATVATTKTGSDTVSLADSASVTTSGTGSTAKTDIDTVQLLSNASVSKSGQQTNSWQQSGLWGAGFQNTIAPSPLVPGLVIAGGDVSGFHLSRDFGDTWQTQNGEITASVDKSVASIAWHPTDKNRVFAATGNGTSGGIWESQDQGVSWVKRSSTVVCAGTSHTDLTDTGEHPRSVGRLLAVDAAANFLYVGTFDDGVYRAPITPTGLGAFTRIALAPTVGGKYYIRTLAQDPNDPDMLYVSTYFRTPTPPIGVTLSGKVWRVENASTTTPNAVEFVNSPVRVEDIVVLGTTLYAVAYEGATGDRGLWTLNNCRTSVGGVARGTTFATWWNRTTLPIAGGVWYSIDGIKSADNVTLYCGADNSVNDGTGTFQSLFKLTSADGGATLALAASHPVSFNTTGTSGNVRKLVAGIAGERDWWMFDKQQGNMFGKGGYTPAMIQIDKSAAVTTPGGGTGSGRPPVRGLCGAGQTTVQAAYVGHISAITVYADWKDLQDTNTTTLSGPDVAMIDNALTYGAANSVQIKIRLFCGARHGVTTATPLSDRAGSPTWLQAQVGTFQHKDQQDVNKPIVPIACYWKPAFLTAYDKLMQLMAARWDANANLRDITISGAMTLYAEPFIMGAAVPQNRAELCGGGVGWSGTNIPVPGAGYTDAKNIAAHKSFIDSHALWLTNTNSSLAFNPYQTINSYTDFNAQDLPGIPKTKMLIDYFKDKLGSQGVVENNSIAPVRFTYASVGGPATGIAGPTTNAYGMMYTHLKSKGPPSFYQTQNANQIADANYPTVGQAFEATMKGADTILAANGVEPPPGFAGSTNPELQPANFEKWDNIIAANPIPTTGGGTATTTYPNKNRVYLAGRSGLWRTSNAEAAASSVLFYPIVHTLGVTICRPLICDPSDPDREYSGSTDWTFLYSTDAMVTVGNNDTGINASVGLSIAADETTTPTTLYLGVGTRDTNTLGEVYSHANPSAGTAWASTGLAAAAGGAQPIGLIALKNGAQTILLAAVTDRVTGSATVSANAGVYRKVGAAAWAQVTAVTPTNVVMTGEASRSADFATRRGTSIAYLMDRSTGIWRSTDYGATWVRILNHTTADQDYVGYIQQHPTDSTKLYTSLDTGVYRIDNANTVAQDSAILVNIAGGSVVNPGAMKVTTSGDIYCIQRQPPKIWRSTVTNPTVWSAIDDSVYRDTAIFAFDLDVDTTGRAYVCTAGNGILRQVTSSFTDSDSLTMSSTATVVVASVGGGSSFGGTDSVLLTDTASVSTGTVTTTTKSWAKRS